MRKQIEARLRRMRGPDGAARARLEAFNEKVPEWYGVCRHCGFNAQGILRSFRGACPNCGAGGGNGQ